MARVRVEARGIEVKVRCVEPGCRGLVHLRASRREAGEAGGGCDGCGHRYSFDHGVLAPVADGPIRSGTGHGTAA